MSNITMHEVSKHKTVDDCWVVAHGKVYDITEFVKDILVGNLL